MKKEKKDVIIESGNGKYLGAQWIGAENVLSGQYGILVKDTIYNMPEATAKISAGFKPVYEKKGE